MTLTPQTISKAANACIASYFARMDKCRRTRFCGIEEAIRLVGAKKLEELMQNKEIEYYNPRTDSRNAKFRFRRLQLLKYTRPMKKAGEYLANNI